MPELLLELFSEEIPARLQARAAEDLKTRVERELAVAPLALEGVRVFSGPRRITLVGYLPSTTPASSEEFRGPRKGAPRPAIAGFLDTKVIQPLSLPGGKLEKAIEALEAGSPYDDFIEPAIWPQASMSARAEWRDTGKGEFLYATVERPPRPAKDILCDVLPYVIRTFPWPKSMRWGNSTLTWVRPLQRILCLLDGEIVPFDLRHGEDDGHGLASGDLTEGHRIMAPGAFAVRSFAEYEAGLRERKVILDAEERARLIRDGIAGLAAREGLQVVADEGLLAEVAGLVEWPVPLLGRIDGAFMDLPVEVMRTTMRVNQRYFTLRHPDGSAAPRFALVANIEPADGGAAVIGGNERVLRARLADARFFWDQDRKHKLEDFLPKLEDVVFHAKLGTQGERVRRLEKLAALIAPMVGADPVLAARAARLAKADLASGMVGEFPELQGIMGRYYALHGGEDPRVAEAIAAHYRPLGPADDVPREPVAIAVALADKLDQLAGFFAVGEKPTGSGDPFALRRAALGVIRIIRENGLRLELKPILIEVVRRIVGSIVAASYDKADHLLESISSGGGLSREDLGVLMGLPLGAFLDKDKFISELRDESNIERRHEREQVLASLLTHLLALDLRSPLYDEYGVAELDALALPQLYAVQSAEIANRQSAQGVDLEAEDRFDTRSVYVQACRWLQSELAEPIVRDLLDFLAERLRVQLRSEGARHDVVAAVFGAAPDDDLVRLLARADALRVLIESPDGANLLTAYRRAANILRIEDRKDGPHRPPADPALLRAPEEIALADALAKAEPAARERLTAEDFTGAMAALAALRAPVDDFFDRVTVNDPDPELRRNRLALLAGLRAATDAVADLSKIEG